MNCVIKEKADLYTQPYIKSEDSFSFHFFYIGNRIPEMNIRST